MKSNASITKILDIRILFLSFLVNPIFVFLHEGVHIVFFTIFGFKAHLQSLAFTAIDGFDYSFSGLSSAIVFYNTSPLGVAVSAIAAPVFTLLISVIFLISYAKYRKDLFYCIAFNPLVIRLIGISIQIPQILQWNRATDEAVAAYFVHVPLAGTVFLSLLLHLAICIALMILPVQGARGKTFFSALLGGAVGFAVVDYVATNFIIQPLY